MPLLHQAEYRIQHCYSSDLLKKSLRAKQLSPKITDIIPKLTSVQKIKIARHHLDGSQMKLALRYEQKIQNQNKNKNNLKKNEKTDKNPKNSKYKNNKSNEEISTYSSNRSIRHHKIYSIQGNRFIYDKFSNIKDHNNNNKNNQNNKNNRIDNNNNAYIYNNNNDYYYTSNINQLNSNAIGIHSKQQQQNLYNLAEYHQITKQGLNEEIQFREIFNQEQYKHNLNKIKTDTLILKPDQARDVALEKSRRKNSQCHQKQNKQLKSINKNNNSIEKANKISANQQNQQGLAGQYYQKQPIRKNKYTKNLHKIDDQRQFDENERKFKVKSNNKAEKKDTQMVNRRIQVNIVADENNRFPSNYKKFTIENNSDRTDSEFSDF